MNIIKQRREAKMLTQDQLSQAIGHMGGSALVSKWENGTHRPSMDSSEKLSKVLGGEPHEYRLREEHKEN